MSGPDGAGGAGTNGAPGTAGHGAPPSTEELLARARRHAEGFTPAAAGARVAIVACMDRRIDVPAVFGLEPGEAYIIRNAGGVVTDDVVRSLSVAQVLQGTTEILLVHHTDCGMCGVDDDALADRLEAETGVRPEWRAHGFTDVEADLRAGLARLATDPHVPFGGGARGFIYDVATGTLIESGAS